MKLTIFLSAIALASASAQTAPMKPAPAVSAAARSSAPIPGTASPVGLQSIQTLEKDMDAKISSTGGRATPCGVLSPTRGLYVSGLGAVFTAEVELAPTPGGVALFQTAVGPQQKAKYRGDKQTNIPLLEQTLREVAMTLASSPALKLADNEQVVVAARLFYRPWEDSTGMPAQIVAHLDRRGGAVKMELQ